MLSSAEDLVKFCQALSRGLLLSDSLSSRMFEELPIEPGAGLAWGSRVDSLTGTRRVWHPGRSNGFESYLLYYPTERVAVAVLTNQHYTDPWADVGGVAQVLADVFMPGQDSLRANFVTTPFTVALRSAFDAGGADSMKTICLSYRASPAWRHWGFEGAINMMGYGFLQGGQVQEAVEVFLANVELFPDSWNAFDSLAEAYAKLGNIERAIHYYEASLLLNPKNEAGAKKLSELKR